MKDRPDLERRIDEVKQKLPSDKHWNTVIRLRTLPHPSNPYARIEYGAIMSNGLHEKAMGYYVIYWDGSILKSAHSV